MVANLRKHQLIENAAKIRQTWWRPETLPLSSTFSVCILLCFGSFCYFSKVAVHLTSQGHRSNRLYVKKQKEGKKTKHQNRDWKPLLCSLTFIVTLEKIYWLKYRVSFCRYVNAPWVLKAFHGSEFCSVLHNIWCFIRSEPSFTVLLISLDRYPFCANSPNTISITLSIGDTTRHSLIMWLGDLTTGTYPDPIQSLKYQRYCDENRVKGLII